MSSQQKIVVITGASSGIGASPVTGFSAIGDGVVATARSMGKTDDGTPATSTAMIHLRSVPSDLAPQAFQPPRYGALVPLHRPENHRVRAQGVVNFFTAGLASVATHLRKWRQAVEHVAPDITLCSLMFICSRISPSAGRSCAPETSRLSPRGGIRKPSNETVTSDYHDQQRRDPCRPASSRSPATLQLYPHSQSLKPFGSAGSVRSMVKRSRETDITFNREEQSHEQQRIFTHWPFDA